jgi:hypothetical protein
MASSRLSVELDGNLLEAEEARAVWERFSHFMSEGGDLVGFAKSEGVLLVSTAVRQGVPTLIVTSLEA